MNKETTSQQETALVPEVITDPAKDTDKIKKEAQEALNQGDPSQLKADITADIHKDRKEFFRQIGRKGGISRAKKSDKWKAKFPDLAYRFARLGARDEDIAAVFNISERTLYEWKKRRPPLLQAIKKGRAERNLALIGSAFELALSGNSAATGAIIFLLKNWAGMTDKVDTKVSGELGITYRSNIPQEAGAPDIDPGTQIAPKKEGEGPVSDSK